MTMIVNSVAYRAGKRLGHVDLDHAGDLIREPKSFVWLGLHEHDPHVLERIQAKFGLHELAIEDARKAHQRPKLESYGESLFVVVKTAQLQDGQVVYGETHFFVSPHFLISVRHGCSQGYAVVRDRCEQKPDMLAKGPGYALYALIDFIVDNYQPVVQHFSQSFDKLEGRIFTGTFDPNAIELLYQLKIELLGLRNAVVPIEDICNQLMRLYPEIIPKELRDYFRDIHDHAARIIDTVDNMREMLTTAMQVNLALVSVRQNEVVQRLAGWGAILAIPTVVFSMYGMNFRIMPELRLPWGYPLVLGGTALACSWLYRKLKLSGWL